jgi:hypothetical protein
MKYDSILYILFFLIVLPIINSYKLFVSIDNLTINAPATYTYNVTFNNTISRNITLNFPVNSDISGTDLQVYLNSILLANTTSYTVNTTAKAIFIFNPSPFVTLMSFKVMNVRNPPSVVQNTFTVNVVLSEAL